MSPLSDSIKTADLTLFETILFSSATTIDLEFKTHDIVSANMIKEELIDFYKENSELYKKLKAKGII